MEKIDTSIFWDINPSMSRNCLFNFIVGNRGGGKTYGAKRKVIERFIKSGEQFVYLRRFKEELKDIGTFFDDIAEAFPQCEFKVKGKTFYINNEIAGHAVPLSTSKIKKSVPMPKVSWIIFDEFIIDKGFYRYLPDEVTCFLEFYETVARTRDNVRVYFLSNALTITNPYFLYFKLELPTAKSNIKIKDDILIELVAKQEFIEFKKQTRFGKLISGTKYGDYAIENTFFRDNSTFIEKKTGQCAYSFGIKYLDNTFGIWTNANAGKMYVSYDTDDNFPYKFTVTKADHTPNTLLIESMRKYRPFQYFIKNFQMGNVYFEDMNIKNQMYDLFSMAQLTK